jgi:hypothetical protein
VHQTGTHEPLRFDGLEAELLEHPRRRGVVGMVTGEERRRAELGEGMDDDGPRGLGGEAAAPKRGTKVELSSDVPTR